MATTTNKRKAEGPLEDEPGAKQRKLDAAAAAATAAAPAVKAAETKAATDTAATAPTADKTPAATMAATILWQTPRFPDDAKMHRDREWSVLGRQYWWFKGGSLFDARYCDAYGEGDSGLDFAWSKCMFVEDFGNGMFHKGDKAENIDLDVTNGMLRIGGVTRQGQPLAGDDGKTANLFDIRMVLYDVHDQHPHSAFEMGDYWVEVADSTSEGFDHHKEIAEMKMYPDVALPLCLQCYDAKDEKDHKSEVFGRPASDFAFVDRTGWDYEACWGKEGGNGHGPGPVGCYKRVKLSVDLGPIKAGTELAVLAFDLVDGIWVAVESVDDTGKTSTGKVVRGRIQFVVCEKPKPVGGSRS